uniref:Uncharacterized protein n=1 Tax=Arundo donax TaxID=35708 RepID=A0A0A9C997_ARUDO
MFLLTNLTFFQLVLSSYLKFRNYVSLKKNIFQKLHC